MGCIFSAEDIMNAVVRDPQKMTYVDNLYLLKENIARVVIQWSSVVSRESVKSLYCLICEQKYT